MTDADEARRLMGVLPACSKCGGQMHRMDSQKVWLCLCGYCTGCVTYADLMEELAP